MIQYTLTEATSERKAWFDLTVPQSPQSRFSLSTPYFPPWPVIGKCILWNWQLFFRPDTFGHSCSCPLAGHHCLPWSWLPESPCFPAFSWPPFWRAPHTYKMPCIFWKPFHECFFFFFPFSFFPLRETFPRHRFWSLPGHPCPCVQLASCQTISRCLLSQLDPFPPLSPADIRVGVEKGAQLYLVSGVVDSGLPQGLKYSLCNFLVIRLAMTYIVIRLIKLGESHQNTDK